MLSINPIITINSSFKSVQESPVISSAKNDTSKKKDNKQLYMALAGLAVLGTVAVVAGKKSISTYEQALAKNGVQIKDGIATVKATGEKYTGSIKRNTQAFGYKKETVQFADGVMTEKVYHDLKGAELEGEFFKDGKRRVRVTCDCGKELRYERYIFTSDGKLKIRGQCHNQNKDKFESARDIIKGLK